MAQQSSRLHRLLTLLDTGSTQATRFTAARQIGDIARAHPQDLNSLLRKVSQFLRSKNWDTRVAAAHAIGAIAENVKHGNMTDLFACVESEMSDVGISAVVDDLIMAWPNFHPKFVVEPSFRSFDISKVLEFGALLASGGQEYDILGDSNKTPGERIARQKQNLRCRLGLDMCEQFMDVNDMIRDEDLLVEKYNFHGNGMDRRYYTSQSGNRIQQLVANMVPSVISKRPSARELNLLKRKAKINAKDQTKGWAEDGDFDVSYSQNSGTPKGSSAGPLGSSKASMDTIDEDSFENDGDGRWPFHNFVEQLILDMFDPSWEVRHGSIMALREILTHQGSSAGVSAPDLYSKNELPVDSEDKIGLTKTKREREIDLNVQVGLEESEPSLKRQRYEDVLCDTISIMSPVNKNIDVEPSLKRETSEDVLCDTISIMSPMNKNIDVEPSLKRETFEDVLCDTISVMSPVNKNIDVEPSLKGEMSEDVLCDTISVMSPVNKNIDVEPSLKGEMSEDVLCDTLSIMSPVNKSIDVEPSLKRVMSEDVLCDTISIMSPVNKNIDVEPSLKGEMSEDVLCDTISIMSPVNKNIDVDACIKVEDGGVGGSVPGHINGGFDCGLVKVEQESCADELQYQHSEGGVVAESSSLEDGSSMKALNILNNLPESCKLIKLVKLTRDSWIKNLGFLQDCSIRFLCVLSLDRFGDYVSDQVVAPVRETCAQALGAALKYMHPSLVRETLNILLQIQCRPEWEIRHGSLLGIKYLVAVRREMLHDLLGCVLPACKAGLEDPDDDVRAVAAEALIPAAAAIVSLNGEVLHSIVMLLWDILLDLDDLSPSTSSVMNLLAEIYSQEEMIPKMFGSLKEKKEFDLNELVPVDEYGAVLKSEENPYILSTLAPRLWPFMRHSITSVRHSAIRTLERLLEAGYRGSSSESKPSSFWPSFILGDTLRIVFQNLLLESNEQILQCSERVWSLLLQCPEHDLETAARSYFPSWIELATTPYGSPLDATKMFWPVALPRKSHFKAAAKMRAAKLDNDCSINFGFDSAKGVASQERNGDVTTSFVKIIVGADGQKSVTHTRVVTASALGLLASKLPEESLQFVIDPLWSNLISLSGVQRQVASMLLVSWFKEIKNKDLVRTQGVMSGFIDQIRQWLLDLLSCTNPSLPTKDSPLPYGELSRTYAKMRNEASLLLRITESSALLKNMLMATKINPDALSVDDAINFASKLLVPNDQAAGEETIERHLLDDFESSKQRLLTTSGYLRCVQNNLHVTVSALVAAAVVWMSELPVRLNPIILPLMASIKKEQEEVLQQKAAEALAELIYRCTTRKPSPNDKLIKNLCSLTCMDPCETPQAANINSMEIIDDQDLLSFGRGAGQQKTKVNLLSGGEDRSKVEGFISRRGSELALKYLCARFGGLLFDMLPKLWDCLTEVLKPWNLQGTVPSDDQHMLQAIDSVKDPQILINNIQVVRSVASLLDDSLKPKLLSLLQCIFVCVRHYHVAVRLAAARCITSMAKSMTVSVMRIVIEKTIPMLGDTTSVHTRQGAGMLVSLLVQGLGVELVPYAPLLVVPLLRCMSDCDHAVRQSVTHSFAALVPLLPLARGAPPLEGLSECLSKNAEDAQFLEQLLDNSNIDDYQLSIDLKVTLRRYQQEGINWLAFLRRFKLHGILCDDMGLGKTLQASAIVASDIAEHRASKNEKDPVSLIICPSTLVGHWAYEIEKFIDPSVMIPLQYVGSAQERISLRCLFEKHNVVITSYDVVRKDIDYLKQQLWNYCILDEGHIIKNAKSKITTAVKQLKAEHRLLLSGTPIQNNILELWSLFDFLMPGFLGTERQFQATYGKPLVAARDPKCSAKDAEAGVLAMEALHKQVMPFLLRRTKDEVLSDLPEKIIQDRFCDLSPVQLRLYEQFSGSDARKEISTLVHMDDSEDTGEGRSASPRASSHVFQALQYLLKLCSHPLLVLGEKLPGHLLSILSSIMPGIDDIISNLHELHHSPKLVALHEILEECGIGSDTSSSEGAVGVGQHRVLIFAQHKALLDIIEKDLFQAHMKSVTYLRLDGSVEPEKRFEIVKAFNSDPTIDVLLLTTHVGGLGLNLTSADTLVFMEHDWNPMRDHQAMDRAHRLGQRKVVNVHRLIMRGTLEEKVMSLQKFKVSVANAVINSENTSLKTMNTDQLLDLFTSAQTSRKGTAVSKSSDGGLDGEPKSVVGGRGLKAILGGLEELWDQSQYTEEYSLNQFLTKLNGA